MSGQIVDSSLVAAPKQRNTRDEKQAIKAGRSAPEIWPDQPAKARQFKPGKTLRDTVGGGRRT